ncbi:MAG: cbb3-type cytochrome oxidase assembly protein [Candidatus Melainabacteria bacterium]|nr:cbb3-type cytochrome oxidase assembly protein [Candidatus Melainabacteria bacterium]MBI3308745.1 cbb3-type cytochrome oxidase assembly protein [Candidatus Melainabacteria bacterium]
MCPNCVLNKAGLGAAYYGAFTICIIFALVALALYIWGKKSGEFTGDPEEAKYSMFDEKNS